jgi:hypothetical protein
VPVATVSNNNSEHCELKSLPSGWVDLKRMTYGETLERRALMKLSFTTRKGQKDLQGELAMGNRRIQLFEFQRCIVDHNLTDELENKLNLSDPASLDRLDPRVGQEIEDIISKMNNFEDDEDEAQRD